MWRKIFVLILVFVTVFEFKLYFIDALASVNDLTLNDIGYSGSTYINGADLFLEAEHDSSTIGKEVASVLQVVTKSNDLPKIYLAFPAERGSFNWGKLHQHNAVDIANKCGTNVFAAEAGQISKTEDVQSWNRGFGGNIEITHENGIKTLYAHLERVFVSVGERVSRGDVIGVMGNTGKVHGPTGCHVHFEVIGAQNPFAK